MFPFCGCSYRRDLTGTALQHHVTSLPQGGGLLGVGSFSFHCFIKSAVGKKTRHSTGENSGLMTLSIWFVNP